ncbi:MAG TPA: hypothetical protein VF655_08020 [Allosphingosinicella sp.]|jgi:ABC-type glycerol-3-phosphate transport system substrate-binding protein
MIRTVSVFALALALAACGGSSEADNTAAALEDAASQSTPEAAAVLENAADQIQEQNVTAPISEPGSPGQQAMQAAGAAQAKAKAPTVAPPSQGAKPHAKGDPVPPPKVDAGAAATENHAGH